MAMYPTCANVAVVVCATEERAVQRAKTLEDAGFVVTIQVVKNSIAYDNEDAGSDTPTGKWLITGRKA